jgi:putative membrane protein (TIGR04086 family)
VLGVVVDTAGTVCLVALYVLILFGFEAAGELDSKSLSTSDLVATEVLGLLPSVLGGFVAARKANRLHVQHGIAVGAGSLIVWLVLEWGLPSEGTPVWYDLLSIGVAVPAAALGGWAAGRRRPGREGARARH